MGLRYKGNTIEDFKVNGQYKDLMYILGMDNLERLEFINKALIFLNESTEDKFNFTFYDKFISLTKSQSNIIFNTANFHSYDKSFRFPLNCIVNDVKISFVDDRIVAISISKLEEVEKYINESCKNQFDFSYLGINVEIPFGQEISYTPQKAIETIKNSFGRRKFLTLILNKTPKSNWNIFNFYSKSMFDLDIFLYFLAEKNHLKNQIFGLFSVILNIFDERFYFEYRSFFKKFYNIYLKKLPEKDLLRLMKVLITCFCSSNRCLSIIRRVEIDTNEFKSFLNHIKQL